MKIFIGSDHRGFSLKKTIIGLLPDHVWIDVGCNTQDRTDFPIYAHNVCEEILKNSEENRGILLCNSGVGMSIAANRYKKIYAALCWNEEITKSARSHNNANVLVLPAGYITQAQAITLVKIFLTTPFDGGTYERRLCMIEE